jgi:hypothetical protein
LSQNAVGQPAPTGVKGTYHGSRPVAGQHRQTISCHHHEGQIPAARHAAVGSGFFAVSEALGVYHQRAVNLVEPHWLVRPTLRFAQQVAVLKHRFGGVSYVVG